MGAIKKFMYIHRTAPHGSIYAKEGLEVALIGAAFDQDVSMAFIDDGVFQIKSGQDTSATGMKNFSPAWRALGDYDITRLYVEKRIAGSTRGLNMEDLMPLTWEDENDDYNRETLNPGRGQ